MVLVFGRPARGVKKSKRQAHGRFWNFNLLESGHLKDLVILESDKLDDLVI